MVQLSVVMAVRDGAGHLAAALDSILTQTGPSFEVIVVDDGSRDGTAALLEACTDARVTVLTSDTGIGLPASLNRGLAAATGAVVARMDADDLCLPGRFARQLAAMEAARADVCFCGCRMRDEASGREWSVAEPAAELRAWRCLFTNAFGAHPAVMVRRELLVRMGGYDERFPRGQDYELWDRCAAAGARFLNLDEDLLLYRVHPDSVSSRHFEEQFETGRIVSDRALARAFPDSTAAERHGLQHLMCARIRPAEADAVGQALDRCGARVRAFADTPAVWADVAAALVDRLAQLPPSLRRRAAALAARAALRGRAPRQLLRLARRLTG
ncbi:MAG: glycosyltransferase family 2 protein [Actinomycetota bacterium]